MTGWLLDSNILSELRRARPERQVVAFVAAQPPELLHVSTATIAEIRFGIAQVVDPGRRADLEEWLAHKMRPMFAQRILAITEDIMFRWRLMVEAGRRANYAYSRPDLIIAATALHHGLTVVTRNGAGFVRSKAPILNPWLDRWPPQN